MKPDDELSTARPAAPDSAERRNRLRQYQVQLLDRMQAAKSGSADGGKELGVMIGHSRCLLDLTQVGEIVPTPAITTVPLTHDWYLGLANIRGNLIGIVDLARYRGEAAGTRGPENRVITFGAGLGFNCALLAARVLGLRRIGEMEQEDPAPGAPAWSAQRFRDSEAHSWTRIDLSLLVQDSGFLHVGF
ncbi:twitching motility protein PilI [Oxalobacteraceae bacterium GrIS 1.11]